MVVEADLGVKIEGLRFRSRISVASGRSVRVILEMLGSEWANVRPTIPQPAPSSRTSSLGLTRRDSRAGRRGRVFGIADGVLRYGDSCEIYADRTRPASLS